MPEGVRLNRATLSNRFGGKDCSPYTPQVWPRSFGRRRTHASVRSLVRTRSSSSGRTGLKSPAMIPRPAALRYDAQMESWCGLSDGLIGNESKWTLTSRIRRELLPEVCLLEEFRIRSQHRASRSKRLGNETLQIAPSTIPSVATQSFDTKLMLINFCFPKAEKLTSLMYQLCCIQRSSRSAASDSLDTSCRKTTSAAPMSLMTCSSADIRTFGNGASAFTFQLTRRNEPAH